MLLLPLLAALLTTIYALPTTLDIVDRISHLHSHRSRTASLKTRTPKDPIFHISAYLQHNSPSLNSVSFSFSDPRHHTTASCSIPGSSNSVYLSTFTSCTVQEEKPAAGKKGYVGFRVSEGEVTLRVGWWQGDEYYVGYAPQPTYWNSATNISLTFDQGETYTRYEDWWFPCKSMTVG